MTMTFLRLRLSASLPPSRSIGNCNIDIANEMPAIRVASYPSLFSRIKVSSGQISEPMLVTIRPQKRIYISFPRCLYCSKNFSFISMTYSMSILRKPGNGNRICDILSSAVLLYDAEHIVVEDLEITNEGSMIPGERYSLPAAEQTPTGPVPTEKALKQFLPKAAV